jgi:TPP-dependent pyruvate/acetoin dehydrogenase alpha subunit
MKASGWIMRRRVRLSGAVLERTYELMARMRRFEEALTRMWDDGLVPGEMHTGIGEEGIVAGVLSHLTEHDALALDHRATPALVGRGVDMEQILLEVCGHEHGLNGGRGGHMHLFAPDQRTTSDGMVGASGPLACGLAMAGRQLRPGSVAVAFFGEAAVNEGYLMEAFNLAAAWNLPVLFVCKDNSWSITTRSSQVTGERVIDRAAASGLATRRADGNRVDHVHESAGKLIRRIRRGKGPGFLLASCYRPQRPGLPAGELLPAAGPLHHRSPRAAGPRSARPVAGARAPAARGADEPERESSPAGGRRRDRLMADHRGSRALRPSSPRSCRLDTPPAQPGGG